MSTWNELPDQVPADGTEYWVVFERWFGRPFLATWTDASGEWKCSSAITAPYFPWYVAPRWKPL